MSHQMKAGKYFVGDPCYVIPNNEWGTFSTAFLANPGQPIVHKGEVAWSDFTANGDGVFLDNHGVEYGVDSGSIGIVPLNIADPAQLERAIKDLGSVVEFHSPFAVDCVEGLFVIGHLTINTRDTYEVYEEEEYDVLRFCVTKTINF